MNDKREGVGTKPAPVDARTARYQDRMVRPENLMNRSSHGSQRNDSAKPDIDRR